MADDDDHTFKGGRWRFRCLPRAGCTGALFWIRTDRLSQVSKVLFSRKDLKKICDWYKRSRKVTGWWDKMCESGPANLLASVGWSLDSQTFDPIQINTSKMPLHQIWFTQTSCLGKPPFFLQWRSWDRLLLWSKMLHFIGNHQIIKN